MKYTNKWLYMVIYYGDEIRLQVFESNVRPKADYIIDVINHIASHCSIYSICIYDSHYDYVNNNKPLRHYYFEKN